MRSERVPAGRIARWLLLACTILGLAAMHSLGHGSSHTGAGHGEHASAAGHGKQLSAAPAFAAVMSEPMAASMTAFAAVLAAAPAAVAGGGCSGDCHGAGGPGRHDDDISGFSVCLAVLAAFGIAMLLAWLRLRTPVPTGALAHPSARWATLRAPPTAGAGLRLAALSVMRR